MESLSSMAELQNTNYKSAGKNALYKPRRKRTQQLCN